MQVPVEQAKRDLDALIERSAAGEEVLITRDGRAVARVVPPARANGAPSGPRRPGWGKGVITYIAPDFDAPLEDFREYTG